MTGNYCPYFCLFYGGSFVLRSLVTWRPIAASGAPLSDAIFSSSVSLRKGGMGMFANKKHLAKHNVATTPCQKARSMIRKYHNFTLQTNPRLHEEEPKREHLQYGEFRKTTKAKPPVLLVKMIAKLEWTY